MAAPAPDPTPGPALDPLLAELVERWRGPLVGLARAWRVADPVVLAQDAFAELWLGRDRFEGAWEDDAAVGPWLRGIAWNLAAAERRRAARSARAIDDAEPLADARWDGAAAAERSERSALLREAIEELPAEGRAIVLMVALERAPHARVAALLGISERAVEGRLYRARRALARALDAKGIETPARPEVTG